MNAPTSLAEMKNPPAGQDVKIDFFSKNGFELACRIAKAFSTSDAVPAQFRQLIEKKERGGSIVLAENPAALGNCLVAIEVSRAVDMSVVSVMQNADIIQGKLRWSSKFQIAAINASGRFSPLKFKLTNLGRIKARYKEKLDWNKQQNRYNFAEHEVEIDNWECVAWAYELDGHRRPTAEVVQSIPVTMQMAVEEGWYSKEGSKWQGSMRFQMLQYRAGTFFGSIYAPDVLMGMGKSSEEEYDNIGDIPQPDGTTATLQELRSAPDVGHIPQSSTDPHETVDAETGEIHEPTQQRVAATDADAPGFADAHAAIRDGDLDLARDIARSLPDAQRQQIEQAITNLQSDQQQDAPARGRSRQPRGQGGLGLE